MRDAIARRPMLTAALVLLLGAGLWLATDAALGWRHWGQAQRLLRERELDSAAPHVAACLDRWPDNADAHLLAARSARLRKDADEAFRQLELARKSSGNIERIVLEKYLLRAERGEMRQVERKLIAFLAKSDADAVGILDVLSYQCMMAHRFAEGLQHLQAWAQQAPAQPEPVMRRAWIEERLRDFPAALADYQKALDLDPDADARHGGRVRLLLAELLLQRLRPQEALGHFHWLLERQPNNQAVRFGLARCRLLLGQTDDGVRLLRDIVAADPKHAKALTELGRVCLEKETVAEAEGHLRRALALQPYDKQTVFTLHQCVVKLGKRDEATTLQERLERIRTDERRMPGLMDDVQRSPEDPVHRQQIGEIFLRNGLIEGLRWLDSALMYDGDYAPAHEVLAEWWESRGEPEKAAPHRQELARLGVAAKKVNRFLEDR